MIFPQPSLLFDESQLLIALAYLNAPCIVFTPPIVLPWLSGPLLRADEDVPVFAKALFHALVVPSFSNFPRNDS